MESSGLDVGGGGGGGGGGNMLGGMARGYGSPGAYAASPRGVYASPRSQGYSPSPARPAGTPQPQARFSQSPHPHHPHPYSHSPAPQGRPFSRSPAPVSGVGGVGGVGTTPFPQASPAGALHSYTPSPAHTPYSQHSSPAPARTPTYTEPHHYAGGAAPAPGFGGELSHEIGAAISSPAPVSPGMAALDFEPPRERDARDDPDRDHSPMGSTDMHPGSNSNSSLSDYNKVSGAPGPATGPAPRYSAVCPQTAASDMSPAGAGFGAPLYDERLHYAHLQHTHSPAPDKQDHYYRQDQGTCRPPSLPRRPRPAAHRLLSLCRWRRRRQPQIRPVTSASFVHVSQ
ncbi:hypothetical protein HF086_003294 [Spodoptera exigua]|uniref:Uncharacterized protein n=1 Tax=Spodoptera exigua TaxID=7107 RepID=A0A922MY46_SPOEX|nr:hypothetical protein HF086_003294 [Spodoptera exigua]